MNAVLTFSGNLQRVDGDTGLDRLFFEVVRQHANHEITTYHPRTWKSNTRRLLQQPQRNHIEHLFLIGYSHGQVPCLEIARQAHNYGIKTVRMALCDPVWRSPLLPKWFWAQLLAVRSMFSSPKITVPKIVYRVDWCRQFIDRPRGHELVAEDEQATFVTKPFVIHRSHARIQWDPQWFDLVEKSLTRWAKPPRAEPV